MVRRYGETGSDDMRGFHFDKSERRDRRARPDRQTHQVPNSVDKSTACDRLPHLGRNLPLPAAPSHSIDHNQINPETAR